VPRGAGLARIAEGVGSSEWIKTTGSKGFHIAVPLNAKADFPKVASFAHRVGKLLVERDPENLTREFLKVDRRGRILVVRLHVSQQDMFADTNALGNCLAYLASDEDNYAFQI
jgi:DNA primase